MHLIQIITHPHYKWKALSTVNIGLYRVPSPKSIEDDPSQVEQDRPWPPRALITACAVCPEVIQEQGHPYFMFVSIQLFGRPARLYFRP